MLQPKLQDELRGLGNWGSMDALVCVRVPHEANAQCSNLAHNIPQHRRQEQRRACFGVEPVPIVLPRREDHRIDEHDILLENQGLHHLEGAVEEDSHHGNHVRVLSQHGPQTELVFGVVEGRLALYNLQRPAVDPASSIDSTGHRSDGDRQGRRRLLRNEIRIPKIGPRADDDRCCASNASDPKDRDGHQQHLHTTRRAANEHQTILYPYVPLIW